MPGTVQHFVVGPVKVQFGDAGAAMVFLGYSRNGVRYRIEPHWLDIPSDDFGGEGGVPSDSQLLGADFQTTIELTKFDKGNIERLTSFDGSSAAGDYTATAGVLPVIGALAVQDGLAATLILNGVNEDKTFFPCWLKGAHERNSGTPYSTYIVGFYARYNNITARLLYDLAAVA